MVHSAQFALALIASILLALPFAGKAVRGVHKGQNSSSIAVEGRACESQDICVVSANAVTGHPGKIRGLFEGCLRANPQTQIVALALQDFSGDPADKEDLPKYVYLPGLSGRFKMRHTLLLSNNMGEGNMCYAYFKGGFMAGMAVGAIAGLKVGATGHAAGPVAGAASMGLGTLIGATIGGVVTKLASKAFSKLGANCGGVAVVVYSLKNDVTLDVKDTATVKTGTTASTKKGSVLAKFGINGRELVIASTHGAEGVRGKERGKGCPATGTKQEHQRVKDFAAGLEALGVLRGQSAEGMGAGAIWAGDFNARSVRPDGSEVGCPIWPQGGADHSDTDLELLRQGRDVLGFREDSATPVTFQSILEGSGLQEADNLKCPTYKKQKPKTPPSTGKGEVEAHDSEQFQCEEEGQTMYYKASHPPSWVDRIFYSSDVPWLTCSELHRLVHQEDHDAVLLTCAVRAGGEGCEALDR